MRKSFIVFWGIFAVLAIMIFVGIFILGTQKERFGGYIYSTVSIEKNIEKLFDTKEVGATESKFVYIEWRTGLFSVGGAGAGGLGAVRLIAGNPEQFASLVPKTESVYVTLETRQTYPRYPVNILVKKYLAFLENRTGVVEYEVVYNNKYDSLIDSYSQDEVTFKDYHGTGWEPAAWFLIILGIFGIIMNGLVYLSIYRRN